MELQIRKWLFLFSQGNIPQCGFPQRKLLLCTLSVSFWKPPTCMDFCSNPHLKAPSPYPISSPLFRKWESRHGIPLSTPANLPKAPRRSKVSTFHLQGLRVASASLWSGLPPSQQQRPSSTLPALQLVLSLVPKSPCYRLLSNLPQL